MERVCLEEAFLAIAPSTHSLFLCSSINNIIVWVCPPLDELVDDLANRWSGCNLRVYFSGHGANMSAEKYAGSSQLLWLNPEEEGWVAMRDLDERVQLRREELHLEEDGAHRNMRHFFCNCCGRGGDGKGADRLPMIVWCAGGSSHNPEAAILSVFFFPSLVLGQGQVALHAFAPWIAFVRDKVLLWLS